MPGVGAEMTRENDAGRKGKEERPVAFIDQSRCDGAPGCPVSRVCPKEALVPDPDAAPPAESQSSWLRDLFGPSAPIKWVVDQDRCTGCLLCAQYCPHRAVVAGERTKSA